MGLSAFFLTTTLASNASQANCGLQVMAADAQGAHFVDNEYDAALSNAPWELEARLKVNATSNYQCVFGRISGSYAEYSLFYKNGIFAFDSYIFNSTGGLLYKEIPVAVPDATWVTVKFTYDGATLNGYLDNVIHYTEAIAFSILPESGSAFRIGNGNNQYYLDGVIDYVKVKRAGLLIVDIDFNEPNAIYTDKISNKTLVLENAPVGVVI